MRTVGLIALIIFFPAFVFAESLININTADAPLLDTLPGIGPSKATAIVDHRTQHGFFARIEDIQNVSGIGASTYADIASLITVGDTVTPVSDATTTSSTASTTPISSGASTYVPPPSALSVKVSGEEVAMLEVPLRLSARVTSKGGAVDSAAQISWSFGDGSSATGSEVEKVYHYAGTYLVTATAIDGSARARDELFVTVKSVEVHIASVSGDGITIMNDATERLDLSGWRLISDTGSFRIPEGMMILPGASVLFPYIITNLPIAPDATLLYPNGVTAARYAPLTASSIAVATTSTSIAVQLPTPHESYNQVQKVEKIISQEENIQSYAEAALAPATVAEPTVAGALQPTASAQTAAVADARASGLFHSPWTLGLFGVMAAAAGIFILL